MLYEEYLNIKPGVSSVGYPVGEVRRLRTLMSLERGAFSLWTFYSRPAPQPMK